VNSTRAITTEWLHTRDKPVKCEPWMACREHQSEQQNMCGPVEHLQAPAD